MKKLSHKTLLARISHGLLALALLTLAGNSQAGPLADARMQVGINLFPAFLAARITPPTSHEHIAVVFAEHRPDIELIAKRLRERLRKKSENDRVTLLPLKGLNQEAPTKFTALFIAQTLNVDELEQVLSFAREHKMLTFSPLPGDVERGVLGGIAVSDRILPSLNMQTLRDHGIDLKPFFKKVSDRYEPSSAH